jgi:hypothetical protein
MTGHDTTNEREAAMTTTSDNLTNAKHLASTVGVQQAWCIQYQGGKHYIVSDAYGQRGSKRRFHVTDDDAIELARKAGVQCSDEGEIL